MNIAEIRQKYPQYNDLSDMELAQGLHKKFYSDMDFGDFSQKIGLNAPKLEPLTEEQKAKPQDMNWGDVAKEGAKGVGLGLVSGLGRVASGLTLGGTDWVDRRLGGNLKAIDDSLAQSAKNAGVGFANDVARFGAEAGGLTKGLGGLIYKGAKTIPQLMAKGAIEGGIYGATSSDTLGDLPRNTVSGGAIGGAASGLLGGASRLAKRLVPALNAEGKAKSLADAFSDKESTKALKRGAKASETISNEISQEMPVIKDNINSKMDNVVQATIGEKPNIEGMVESAKNSYSDYMMANGGKPVDMKPIWGKYSKYTPFEKKSVEDAFKSASFETNAPAGTVEHTHQMRMAIDDAIDSASKKSNNRHVPKLVQVRNDLDKALKTDAGYQAIDNQYAEAMKVQNAYDKGFSASKKSAKPKFDNELERKAWLSGVSDNLGRNLANETNYAKTIADNLSVFKNGLNDAEFQAMKKASNTINKEYSRASSLDKIVNKESAAENLPFWREILESVGSAAGATVGTVEKALYGLSDARTARRIINGTADSPLAKRINGAINQSIPTVSALMVKRLADE